MRYIIVYPNRDYGKMMWNDLKGCNNVAFVERPLVSKSAIENALFRVHFSFRLNGIIELPFKNIWKERYSIKNIICNRENDDVTIVVFTDPALCNYTKSFIKDMKKNANIKLVLVMINSMNRMKRAISDKIQLFDLIYSYDQKESEKYGFCYYPTIYSKVELKQVDEEFDSFYVGVAKDRINKIHSLYLMLLECGLKPLFYVSGVSKRAKLKNTSINYNKWIKYKDVLEFVNRSRSVVEVMDGNNAGVTLRTLEAICYNKKLLTTNKKIYSSKYFNPSYIFVMEENTTKDDILQFLNNNVTVDYGYKGEFSPIHLLERISKDIRR